MAKIDNSEQKLWSIISDSRKDDPYMESQTQYNNLISLLTKLPKETRRAVREEWSAKTEIIIQNKEYKKLHISNGGIITGGDDEFYMDFANWIIAQGKELFEEFQLKGHIAITNYITKYSIPEEDYTFECMVYIFEEQYT